MPSLRLVELQARSGPANSESWSTSISSQRIESAVPVSRFEMPRYAGGALNAPFHPSYHPTQQSFLPPPGHANSQNNAISSPFSSMAQSFDRNTPDTLMSGQMGFSRGVANQNHQAYNDGMAPVREKSEDSRIRNVWKHNLKQEMAMLRSLVDEYSFIAMDTEFPGIVARPIGTFDSKQNYHYQTLRCNVDLLKMIQLGIALFRTDGSLPPADPSATGKSTHMANAVVPYAWQFNFKFSLVDDMYAQDSTTMLSKAGIDFERHSKHGIDPQDFGALLVSSGLVLEPNVTWISFHSGYDFAYLMKLMICKPLPDEPSEFHDYLNKFFPSLFDIKFMVKVAGATQKVNNNSPLSQEAQHILQKLTSKQGLQDTADELGVTRIGQAHQAGSDSLLTGQVYFEMRKKIFGGTIEESKYSGQVWGLNAQVPSAQNRDLNTPNMNGATFYTAATGPSTPQSNTAVPGGPHTPSVFGNFQYSGRSGMA